MKSFLSSAVYLLWALGATASVLVPKQVEERAVTTTTAPAACPTGDALINGAFYG